MPALPLLDLPQQRDSSVVNVQTRDALATYLRGPGTRSYLEGLVFEPFGGPAWAMYQFNGVDETDRPTLLSVRLMDEPGFLPQDFYLGISNYRNGRWDWYRINYPAPSFSIALPFPLPRSSPAQNLYACVICVEQGMVLDEITLTYDYFAPPPVDLRASDGSSLDAVELTWTDPQETYGYTPDFGYDAIAVERATAQQGPWESLLELPAGTTHYFDTAAASLPAGTRFYYRLRTSRDGKHGEPGVPDIGYVNFAPQYDKLVHNMGVRPPAPAYGQVTVEGAFDPDGGALTFEWQFGDADWFSTGNTPYVKRTFLKTTELTLRMTDEEGTVVTQPLEILVHGFARELVASFPGSSSQQLLTTGPVDQSGNTFLNVSYYDGIIKLGQQLNVVWSRRWSPGLRAVVCGLDGSVYAHGSNGLARLNADGELLWARQASDFSYDLLGGVSAVDPQQNLWLGGAVETGASMSAALILKVNSAGDLQWARTLELQDGNYSFNHLSCQYVACDSDGSAVLGIDQYAWEETQQYVQETMLVKLDSGGDIVWQKQIESPDGSGTDLRALRAGSSTHPTVGLANGLYQYLFSITADGSLGWSKMLSPRNVSGVQANGSYAYIATDTGIGRIPLGGNYIDWWERRHGQADTCGVQNGQPVIIVKPLTAADNWAVDSDAVFPSTLSLTDSDLVISSIAPAWTDYQLMEVEAAVVVEGSPGTKVCNFSYGGFPVP